MHFNRFQQGDSVQYTGKRDGLAGKLSGREGFVVARVGGEETLLCVTFGDDAYLLDEITELDKYVKREKPVQADGRGPEVQKRRGVSGDDGAKKGGKRRKGKDEG